MKYQFCVIETAKVTNRAYVDICANNYEEAEDKLWELIDDRNLNYEEIDFDHEDNLIYLIDEE